MAAQLVMTGEVEIAVAGGTENMSQTPYILPRIERGSMGFGWATPPSATGSSGA